jgi:hypothetical protein
VTGDPRLHRLLTQGFRCETCKDQHIGIFDVAFSSPMHWTGSTEKRTDEEVHAALAIGRDILTNNFCLDGEHRFIRCIIPFKIHDSEETFAFGVWGSLSTQNFQHHLDDFFSPAETLMRPVFSWLSNRLPESEDRSYKCRLHFRPRPDRLVLEIGEEDHPFYSAQTQGLSVQRLLEGYTLTGHSLRDASDEH